MGGNTGLLNVVDVEATCWDGKTPPGAVSEIIEIGLTVVDLASGERRGKHGPRCDAAACDSAAELVIPHAHDPAADPCDRSRPTGGSARPRSRNAQSVGSPFTTA
ncbi:hypothetical protein [Nocardia sp. CS682]|uniref:hypothetical protein n=1 Tax=Nocardia sp. CS682 TaxID=1047172 RepID=UPI001F0F7B4B|nr:hypothetical protein [Nocardia sp. CS682]